MKKGSQDSMLLNLPSDLGPKATERYKKLWEEDPQKAREFLKGKGYNLKEVRQTNRAKPAPEETPPEETPPGMAPQDPAEYFMNDGASAVDVGINVSNEMADNWSNYNRGGAEGEFGGSLNWVQNPDGSWKQVRQAGQASQDMIGLEDKFSTDARRTGQQLSGQAFKNYQQPYNFNGVSNVYGAGDLAAGRNKAAKSVFDARMTRMQPNINQQRGDFEQMAAERGWVPGSKVYEQEKNRMESQISDDIGIAENEAYNTGLNEFNTMYDQSVAERGRQIGEKDTLRNRPMQEAQALMGMGPGVRMDQFSDYGPVDMQKVDPMAAYGIDAERFMTEQNLSWQERQQLAEQRFLNRQRKKTQAWQSGENQADRAAQMAGIMASRPPGGSPGLSPQEKLQLERDQMLWERENGFRQPANSGSSSGNFWGSIGGAIASGFGSSLGKAVAE